MINKFNDLPILLKTLFFVVVILFIKMYVFQVVKFNGVQINSLIDISDIGIIFSGAFFVVGLMLASTMSDFKESEKIPGEIACNLEAIEDWILLSFRQSKDKTANIDKNKIRLEFISITESIVLWLNSTDKDSKIIFANIKRLNEIAFYFSEFNVEKDVIKGIQENTIAIRKQLTRAYTISRNDLLAPSKTLLKAILSIIFILVLLAKFKSITADYFVSFTISSLFMYLYFLINGLDNPFNLSGDTEVDLIPIERYVIRLKEGFLVS